LDSTDLLDVDSAMLAVVDPAFVEGFLAANALLIDGAEFMEAAGIRATPQGIICLTGGDGRFGFAALTAGAAVRRFEVCFDSDGRPADGWSPAATIPIESGRVLVGDPGFLREFVHDPFTMPYEVYGPWAILATPGIGRLAISVHRSEGRITARRGDWQPA
jgi:hypothetical protein